LVNCVVTINQPPFKIIGKLGAIFMCRDFQYSYLLGAKLCCDRLELYKEISVFAIGPNLPGFNHIPLVGMNGALTVSPNTDKGMGSQGKLDGCDDSGKLCPVGRLKDARKWLGGDWNVLTSANTEAKRRSQHNSPTCNTVGTFPWKQA
jgi:hypothetical protein